MIRPVPQQLGPNWKPQQFQHWRARGVEALGPTATDIMLRVLGGTTSVSKLAAATDLSVSVVISHVRRMVGKGLLEWTGQRGDGIRATCAMLPVRVPCDECGTYVDPDTITEVPTAVRRKGRLVTTGGISRYCPACQP